MNNKLIDYLDKIRVQDKWSERWNSTIELFRGLGATHVAALTEKSGGNFSIFATIPSSIVDYYSDVAYPSGDPRLEYCRDNVAPIHAGVDYADYWNAPREVEALDMELELVAARCITAIPVHGRPEQISGCICFMSDAPHDRHEAKLAEIFPIVMLGSQIGFNFWREVENEAEVERIGITDREAECLAWATEGYLAEMIAEKMDISCSTVRFHQTNARMKLGAKTNCEAVARAMHLKIITA